MGVPRIIATVAGLIVAFYIVGAVVFLGIPFGHATSGSGYGVAPGGPPRASR